MTAASFERQRARSDPRARFAASVHREQNEEAATKPQRMVAFGFVEAARFLGGQLFNASTKHADAPPQQTAR
jgi:hypothetical protein